ncbi:unnamed protein product [Brachionus calyciflorus]|uniref:Uncharacterized protein n=1 Tax=Brachionus calyciflorus TaxID=104777 RepID=A0A813M0K4_9BILA|nr:unnamed protein product [Brachionus calyciflorus]
MQNDIYIRRVANSNKNSDEIVRELYDFLKSKIEEFPSSTEWGQIDYVVIPKKTNLNQDAYVAFMAFENRYVHLEVANELRKIQQVEFNGRGMLFELNCFSTKTEQQIKNREKFKQILNRHTTSKRYFESPLESQENRNKRKKQFFLRT